MATQGAIPAPDGETANFIDPPSQLHLCIGVHTACLTLAILATGMRVYTRIIVQRGSLWLDDACCMVSLILTVVYSGMMLKSNVLGIGRHMWDVEATVISEAFMWTQIASWVLVLLLIAVKLSFLFFFYRIFKVTTTMRYIIIGGIVFVVVSQMAVFFSLIFECWPVEHSWSQLVSGNCVNLTILPYFAGALSSATDIFILVLPIFPLAKLTMDTPQKARVLAVFGIGVFVCFASLIRLGETSLILSNIDRTWNMGKVGIWSVVEVNVGIVCSCLFVLPAFLRKHLPTWFKEAAARFWSKALTFLSSKTISGTSSFRATKAEAPYARMQDGSGARQHSAEQVSIELQKPAEGILHTRDFQMNSVYMRGFPHKAPESNIGGPPSAAHPYSEDNPIYCG